MPSDVFWAAAIAGGAGLAGSIPTYLVARNGQKVQLASIAAENERLLEEHRQQERLQGAAYQRETLIELQDWLAKLARASGAIHHHDVMNYRQSGKWGRELLGETLNSQLHEALVNVNRYRVRVLDDQIRQAADQFVGLSVEVPISGASDQHAHNAQIGEANAERLARVTIDLNELIGERLRRLL
jgi:hypothetical protein